jgi:Putative DNA-binding domain
MLSKPLGSITFEDIQSLISNEVRESKTLEYKRELSGNGDEDTKEFLADVSSLANAAGGDIIYGIDAVDGKPTVIKGLTNFNEDADSLRIENKIRDGISPRIPGLKLRVVSGINNEKILIVRVPRSWNAPHLVSFKKSSKFYSRNSVGKFQMDVTEIRYAFESSTEISEKIRRWRDERLGRLYAEDFPVCLKGKGLLVLQLFPIDSVVNPSRFNVLELRKTNVLVSPFAERVYNPYVNVDGIINYAGFPCGEPVRSYVQVFRSGVIETACSNIVTTRPPDFTNIVASTWLEKNVIEATDNYLQFMKSFDIQPPILFLMSLLHVKDSCLVINPKYDDFSSGQKLARDIISFPDIMIESFDVNIGRTLRPVFDVLWNAYGYRGSINYNADGNWEQKH